MKFQAFGPFEIPRDTPRVVASDSGALRGFWESAEETAPGISEACGCYVFTLKAPRGSRPWYVGKSEKQSFRRECFAPHKINHYHRAIAERKGKPELIFLAEVTPAGKLKSPTVGKRAAISALEGILIGMAVQRNPNLLNMRGAKMWKDLEVHGFLNTSRKAQSGAAGYLRHILQD